MDEPGKFDTPTTSSAPVLIYRDETAINNRFCIGKIADERA